MRILLNIFCLIVVLHASGQNYEICYPYGADTYCNAKYICDDEYFDSYYDVCPIYGPGIYQPNACVLQVYTFDVNQSGQSVNVEVGGDWEYEKLELTLVGPFTLESSCIRPEISGSRLEFIKLTQNSSLGTVALSNSPGRYYVILSSCASNRTNTDPYISIEFTPELNCGIQPIEDVCETCIGSFAPIPQSQVASGKYLIGAWAKEKGASPNKITYDNPELKVILATGSGTIVLGPFHPQGTIIDGWQRIEEEIIIPSGATNIQIVLSSADVDPNSNGVVYFDDVRMFPFDASMKSYVYDPINMRLSAELDERHYATFYEYDEEGKLVRIKKETEKGVMTIQETKSNSSK